MQVDLFVHRSRMPAPASAVYAWHEEPGAFERLLPPGDRTRIASGSARPVEGGELMLEVALGPFTMRWRARIYDCVPGERFRDLQVSGPFAYFQHSHLMHPVDEATSELEDRIAFALPFGGLGRLAAPLVRRRLRRLFEYRHRVMRQDLERRRLEAEAG